MHFFNHVHRPIDFDYIRYILFETGAGSQFIRLLNKTIDVPDDKDEYALFEVEFVDRKILDTQHRVCKLLPGNIPVVDYTEKYRWHIIDIPDNFNAIQIYRDHAKWNYNGTEWDVTTDVAIKLLGNKTNLLCVLHDSIDMTMSVRNIFSENEEIDLISKYWSVLKWGMKCERLSSLERKIITV